MTDAAHFIEDYRATWEAVMRERSDVQELTRFFHVPCFMISNDGSFSQYNSETSIVEFNRSRYDAFQAGGAAVAKFRGADISSLGPHASTAVVNWELLRPDQTIERAWRHYYTIRRLEDGNKILVSAFQTGS